MDILNFFVKEGEKKAAKAERNSLDWKLVYLRGELISSDATTSTYFVTDPTRDSLFFSNTGGGVGRKISKYHWGVVDPWGFGKTIEHSA